MNNDHPGLIYIAQHSGIPQPAYVPAREATLPDIAQSREYVDGRFTGPGTSSPSHLTQLPDRGYGVVPLLPEEMMPQYMESIQLLPWGGSMSIAASEDPFTAPVKFNYDPAHNGL